jgi:hypothetical protein
MEFLAKFYEAFNVWWEEVGGQAQSCAEQLEPQSRDGNEGDGPWSPGLCSRSHGIAEGREGSREGVLPQLH